MKRLAFVWSLCAAVMFGMGMAATSARAQEVCTVTYTLNSTRFGGGEFKPWIAMGELPPGSVLRSVSVNARLDSCDRDDWASDLMVYVDPTPDFPGGDGMLQVGGYDDYGATIRLWWANGDAGPGTAVIDQKTVPADFPDSIDLGEAGLFVGNGYDGTGFYATWTGTITVTYDAGPADILTFVFPGLPEAAISVADIALTVPYGTEVTALAPTYTMSAGATGAPLSGAPRNFSAPQTYTVTSADRSVVKTYTVTVNVTPASSAADILTFGMPYPGGPIFSGTDITWYLPLGTDTSALAPEYTMSAFATGVPPSGTVRNFGSAQEYTITAQDGVTKKTYEVTVVLSAGSPLINVNLDITPRVESMLEGPAGGLDTRWNQVLGGPGWFDPGTIAKNNLIDSTGMPSDVGFTTDVSCMWEWGTPSLVMLTAGVFQWTWNTPSTWVISGLTASYYDLYLASFHPNEGGGAGKYTMADDNPTTTGAIQFVDNGGPNGNSSTWEMGVNYTVFENVEPDANGKITFTMVGTSGTDAIRAYISGFQLFSHETPTVSSANNILTFVFPDLPATVISADRITLIAPAGTDVRALAPTYTTSPLATGVPLSGTAHDFTNPVLYTITAQDGSKKTYTVTVLVPGENYGLGVKTYNDSWGTSYLNPISTLMAVDPSGTTTQITDIAYPADYNFAAVFPGLAVDNETFSILWEGWFDVSKDGPGDYTFGTESDDGSVVYLDLNDDGDFEDEGELVVSNNADQPPTVLRSTVLLDMDLVRIAIGFYENGGGQAMTARFKQGTDIGWESLDPINAFTGHFLLARPGTAPAAPTGLTAAAGDAVVALDWANNTEADLASYRVYRSTTTGGGYTRIASDLTASAYTDTGVTNDLTYFYVVTAVNLTGRESPRSIEASATPRGQTGTVNVLMGNVNTDKKVDIADAIALLGYLFGGGLKPPPVCAKAADANDDNKLDIADAIKILGYLFSQQSMLAPDHSTITAVANTCKPYAADGIDTFDGKPYFPAQVSGLPPCATPCVP